MMTWTNLSKLVKIKIERSTSFSVQLARKEHHHVNFYVQSLAKKTDEVDAVPEIFLQDGNCIPCALWHLLGGADYNFEKTFSQTFAENIVERRDRTYQQCSDMLKVLLQPCYGIPDALEGKLLLHSEQDGQGHRMAVQVSDDKSTCVLVTGRKISL